MNYRHVRKGFRVILLEERDQFIKVLFWLINLEVNLTGSRITLEMSNEHLKESVKIIPEREEGPS